MFVFAINERKPMGLCAPSRSHVPQISGQRVNRPVQNQRVLHAFYGTPTSEPRPTRCPAATWCNAKQNLECKTLAIPRSARVSRAARETGARNSAGHADVDFVGLPLTICHGTRIFAVFRGNRPKKFRGLSNTRVPGVLYTCVPRSAAFAALIVRTAELTWRLRRIATIVKRVN